MYNSYLRTTFVLLFVVFSFSLLSLLLFYFFLIFFRINGKCLRWWTNSSVISDIWRPFHSITTYHLLHAGFFPLIFFLEINDARKIWGLNNRSLMGGCCPEMLSCSWSPTCWWISDHHKFHVVPLQPTSLTQHPGQKFVCTLKNQISTTKKNPENPQWIPACHASWNANVRSSTIIHLLQLIVLKNPTKSGEVGKWKFNSTMKKMQGFFHISSRVRFQSDQ